MAELKRIMSREEQAKKRQRNQLIIGGILILIMVISTAGYALKGEEDSSQNNVKYNGISFVKDSNGYWQFQFNGNNFVTRYNPLEVNETKVSIFASISDYTRKPLYIENGGGEPETEISRNLYSSVERIQRACLSENCTGDFPIKDCTNNVISFREPLNNENQRVYSEENCIFIVANSTEQLKYADAFLFKVIGI